YYLYLYEQYANKGMVFHYLRIANKIANNSFQANFNLGVRSCVMGAPRSNVMRLNKRKTN
ncbi:hypothetical protein ACFLVE_01105, partial [Chloroflexota bacterium]